MFMLKETSQHKHMGSGILDGFFQWENGIWVTGTGNRKENKLKWDCTSCIKVPGSGLSTHCAEEWDLQCTLALHALPPG